MPALAVAYECRLELAHQRRIAGLAETGEEVLDHGIGCGRAFGRRRFHMQRLPQQKTREKEGPGSMAQIAAG